MAPTAATPLTRRQEGGVFITDLEKLRIHMVGVGGCGMSGAAAMLARRGARVSGSDRQSSADTERLAALGIDVSTFQRADTLPADTELVVVSAAIPSEHPERLEALRRGLPVIKYAQLLGVLMQGYDGVAISGTHGKSTTTAWTAFTLRQAGLDPSFVIGATVGQLGGGSGVGDGRQFIVEACEYDRSFHNLYPKVAAILNIEEDHLDCYKDLAEIESSFLAFAQHVPADGVLILNAASASCRRIASQVAARVEYFGDRDDAQWRAAEVSLVDGCYEFTIMKEGRPLVRVHPRLAGLHNVENALVVAAIADRCGLSPEQIQRGLEEFTGADRRLEQRGEVGGVKIYDDYGHHPTEIRATLRAARERFNPNRLWCIFQPHQHSRTRFLLEDFAASFADADRVIVPDIYFVRDSARERDLVSAQDLVTRVAARGGDARHIAQFAEIVEHIAADVQPGDVVLTMGAGNIWRVADELVQRLRSHLPG